MRVCDECGVKSYDSVEEYKKDRGDTSGGIPIGYPGSGGSEQHQSTCSKVGGAPWQKENYRKYWADLTQKREAEERKLAEHQRKLDIEAMFSSPSRLVGAYYSVRACGKCGSLVDITRLDDHFDNHAEVREPSRWDAVYG